MSSLKKQGYTAFIWDFAGKIASNGAGFIISIFLARLLAPEDFGLIAMIMVIVGISQVFTDIGLGAAIIQRRHIHEVHYSSVFYFNISIGTLLTVITFFSAPLLADFYNQEGLVILTQAIAFTFIINSFSTIQVNKFRKELNFRAITKVSFTSSVSSGIIGVLLAWYGAGIWSLVVQILLSKVIYTFLIWRLSTWKPILKFSFKALQQLWGFGFRMFLVGLLNAVFTRMDFIIMGKIFPAATLGFFQRAKSLNGLVSQYSSGSLLSVLLPLLSKVQKDLPRLQNIVLKIFGIISFIVFLLLGGLYLVSQELIVLLFGSKWLMSAGYFQILALSGYVGPLSAVLMNVLSSRGKSKKFLRLEIYKRSLNILPLVVLFYYGIIAFLYTNVFTAFLAILLNISFVSKEIHIPALTFVRSLMVQIFITVLSVVPVVYLNTSLEYGNFIMLLIKGFEFTFFYVMFNILFRVKSFNYFMEEARPVLNKVLKRSKQ
ncbi:MAG: hypothetical protein COA44_00625 [Arcobacter sp.]|nr:MAG: hypothetical protein COA44_00625 [Arcobacter sp.]